MCCTAATYLCPDDPQVGPLRVRDMVNNRELGKLSRRLQLPGFAVDSNDFTVRGWVKRWREGYKQCPSNTITMGPKVCSANVTHRVIILSSHSDRYSVPLISPRLSLDLAKGREASKPLSLCARHSG
ncbi:hypothetical protein BOTBODRAFT_587324 [Botryobasidium botryosum FD-172 SS1]|uniref:Uncharacterized protein n=1 Tax=Botryobasidium botryosum (strain FD-172 SS1) TaxID=930990 RepID=A0A067LX66_BOTB1|nr:hypothetical protein BOTBODRAFT_587324 [Botryobasidium botryosum FD-172 SS1]